MTKITILGEEPQQNPNLKPIELVKCLQVDSLFKLVNVREHEPSDYKSIMLVKGKKYDGFDLMICETWDDGFYVWLGYFNDGIV